MRRAVTAAVAATGVLVLVGPTLPAQAVGDYGPQTCLEGFVWREAVADDRVCVTGAVRAQAADDNRQASARRDPFWAFWGVDVCRSGYVRREVTAADRVCVTPATRDQVKADNAVAPDRWVTVNLSGGSFCCGTPGIFGFNVTHINVGPVRLELTRLDGGVIRIWTANAEQTGEYGWCTTETDIYAGEGLPNAHLRAIDVISGRSSVIKVTVQMPPDPGRTVRLVCDNA